MFRFHTGSIKRKPLKIVKCLAELRFDSILVRLKVVMFFSTFSTASCFDSILVRLKVTHFNVDIFSDREFRFHTGSIKSQAVLLQVSRELRFDSILVRLKAMLGNMGDTHTMSFRFHTGSIKRLMFAHMPLKYNSVSIPYWFD